MSGEPVARIVSPVRIDKTERKVMNWVASLWDPFYSKGGLTNVPLFDSEIRRLSCRPQMRLAA